MTCTKPTDSIGAMVRCGIVLSAGNGKRLQEYIQQRRGDCLPKQYIDFIGRRSMLQHAWDRATRLIPAERLVVVVAKEHLKFREVHRQLDSLPPSGVVIHPPTGKRRRAFCFRCCTFLIATPMRWWHCFLPIISSLKKIYLCAMWIMPSDWSSRMAPAWSC